MMARTALAIEHDVGIERNNASVRMNNMNAGALYRAPAGVGNSGKQHSNCFKEVVADAGECLVEKRSNIFFFNPSLCSYKMLFGTAST